MSTPLYGVSTLIMAETPETFHARGLGIPWAKLRKLLIPADFRPEAPPAAGMAPGLP
jgi:hypothetical protein